MKNLKGFVTIQSLISNIPNTVAPIGELSPLANTYIKDKGEYNHLDCPGYTLIAKYTDSDTNESLIVPNTLVKEVIEVVISTIDYIATKIRPYDIEDYYNSIVADFYESIYQFTNGPFTYGDDIGLPEWLEWTSLSDNTKVKIWLSDAAYLNQFDDCEIVVIPPVDDIDSFFQSPGTVLSLINNKNLNTWIQSIQNAKNNYPETYIRSFSFSYIPQNGSTPITTEWVALIYGISGDTPDAIKDAFTQYIETHSTHTQQEWLSIMPDLFKRTEFVILPQWKLPVVAPTQCTTGIYSSIINPLEAILISKETIDFYPDAHIEANLSIIPYDYKAIMLIVINGISNIDSKKQFNVLFSDYIPVASTTLDFNRMCEYTKDWIIFIERMLILAESMTQQSSLPANYRKVFRNGKMYLSAIYDNVNYLMLPRL